MYGEADDEGQLAVLDAMVFFSIAGLVASMIMCQATGAWRSQDGFGDDLECGIDPGVLLRAFLPASIGQGITLTGPPALEVRPHDSVAECLLAQVQAILVGSDIDFSPLNEVLLGNLEDLCPPGWAPHLSVYWDGSSEPLLKIERTGRPPDVDSYGGSCDLPGPDGSALLAALVLHPALLPEALCV